ncbi:MAG: TIGR04086 family membrane protein [Firmicutes bacterium]|nr:TIGR04086 family membrane protein [Bacillota bacterium]
MATHPTSVAGAVLHGLVVALVCCALAISAIGFALATTSLSEDTATTLALVGALACAVGGGGWAAFRAQRHGWIVGGSVGCLLMLLLSLIGYAFYDAAQDLVLRALVQWAVGFVAGAAGGIVGVNLGPTR